MTLTHNSNLAVDWTKHLSSPEEKAEFAKTVRNSMLVLTRLYDLLVERERILETAETNDKFDSPAWAYQQASRIGRKAEIKFLKQLINIG